MCLITDKIKFCSCKSSSVEKLEHYWLLHRFNSEKDDMTMGEPMFYDNLLQEHYIVNQQTLLNRLNEVDAFDQVMNFKDEDQLEIAINNRKNDKSRMVFCFKYKNGKWIEEGYDVFGLMNHYDEYMFGKFKNVTSI